MEQLVNNKEPAAEQNVEASSAGVPIRARFVQYISPFLQFFAPLISLRYLGVAFEKINPLNAIGKNYDTSLTWNPTPKERLTRNLPALTMGGILLSAVGLYSKRTYEDMRTLYAEAVGYELNKKPQDVSAYDIFVRSHNKAVQVTASAYLRRTALRTASAASFLVPWIKLTPKENIKPDFTANLEAGVGIAGLYISSEGWMRSQSYFDLQQFLADTAISHSNNHVHDNIQSNQVEMMLLLQRKHLNNNYQAPRPYSPEGEQQTQLSTRIADLLNQTYHNTKKTEPGRFTLGKFNFLVGFGLLDNPESNRGFVELANRSADMHEVKEAAQAIRNGQLPQAVFQSFGIDLEQLKSQPLSAPEQEQTATKFAGIVQPASDKMPASQRSHQDFAKHSADNNLSV